MNDNIIVDINVLFMPLLSILYCYERKVTQ